jgi:hypothetical protein
MPPVIVIALSVVGSLATLIGGWATVAPPPQHVTTGITALALVAVYLLAAGGAYIQNVAQPRYWFRRALFSFAMGMAAFIPYLVVRSRLVFDYPEQVKGIWITSEVAMWLSREERNLSPKDILAEIGGIQYYSDVWSTSSALLSNLVLWVLYFAVVFGICASMFFVAEGIFAKRPATQVEPS